MRDLSLHLMDIIQNSFSAKADRIDIVIAADKDLDKLEMTITDNGAGMDEEILSQVTDPFITTRSTRKVGLGISLLKASSERASGEIAVDSVKGTGTTLKAGFQISHIDRLPLGDIGETLAAVISANPEIDFGIIMKNGSSYFQFDTVEAKQRLGDVPINHYEVLSWIREYLNEGVKITFGGVLDEIDS